MKSLLGGVAIGAIIAGAGVFYYTAGDTAAPSSAEDTGTTSESAEVTVADAAAFLEESTAELREFSEFGARTAWVQNNFITYDTNWLLQRMGAQGTEMSVRMATEAGQYADLDLPQNLERQINALRNGITLPAPNDPAAAARLSELTTRMGSSYSAGLMEIDGEMVLSLIHI